MTKAYLKELIYKSKWELVKNEQGIQCQTGVSRNKKLQKA